MVEGKKSFIAYYDWKDTFDSLPNDKAGELIKHIFAYVQDNDVITEDILVNAVFQSIKNTLQRDSNKYDVYIQKQKANGAKGGRLKGKSTKPKEPKPIFEEPKEPKPIFEEPKEPKPIFEEPKEPKPLFEEPKEPKPLFEEPKEPKPIFEEPKEPKPIFEEPKEPKPLFEEPKEPKPLFEEPKEPKPLFEEPKEPKPLFEEPKQTQPNPTEPKQADSVSDSVSVTDSVSDIIKKKKGVVFPFESFEFKNIWREWKDYRLAQHRFKYASESSEQAALMTLNKKAEGAEEVACVLITEAMGNGWKGWFNEKEIIARVNKKETGMEMLKRMANGTN